MKRLVSIAIAAAVPLAAAPTAIRDQGSGIRDQRSGTKIHTLPLQPANVHWGYFDATVPPILHIASGDRVVVETMVARGIERLKQAGAADQEIPASLKAVEAAIADKTIGPHPLTGPIFVNGAEPGDALEIAIGPIEFLHTFGVEAVNPDGGVLPNEFKSAALRLIRWQRGDTSLRFAGATLRLAPFFGTIGVAPPASAGRVSSRAPGNFGGNLDNKDLVTGSTLYLPVHVAGALLSIGDGHAMQGDGEVTGTAVETSLRGTFDIRVRKGARLRWPRGETATDYISMGLDPDLDEATKIATREMVDFLVAEKKLSREDAYILCSMAGNLHVTQAVDGTKGVHLTLSKAMFAGNRN